MYLPQKPYLPQGDLATLVAYPHPSSLSEEQLGALLAEVDLAHLLQRRDETHWQLSLGEQQRLNIARLFYHRPQFAILDECTSSCSVQVEQMLYRRCRELGIAFVTICHRPALKEFHDLQLNLIGDGTYEVFPIPHSEEEQSRAVREQSMHSASFAGSTEEQFAAARSEPYRALAAVPPSPRRSLLGQLSRLFAIVLPESRAKLALFAAAIAARTALGFAFGRVSGQLLQAALQRDGAAFVRALLRHVALDVAAGVVDEATTLAQNQVAVAWARSLTSRLVSVYFRDQFFYNSKHMDRRVPDADARLLEAQDLASALSASFAGSLAPLVDIVVFGVALSRELGPGGLRPLLGYAAMAAGVLALASPSHRRLNTREKELESAYRDVQTRVKANAESVAFLAGGKVEHKAADQAVAQLTAHLYQMNRAQSLFKFVLFGVYQDVDSYSSMITVPRLLTGLLQLQRGASASDAVAASRNQFLAAATERVLGSAGKLSSLAESVASLLSSSQRVIELLDVADQLHRVRRSENAATVDSQAAAIELRHVDVVTPDGCCLLKDLSVAIPPGQSLFVSGVNGSGKTSLFRVMAGLWPARGGSEAAVVRPPSLSLVPQRPYAWGGSLAQQVTYPRMDRGEDRARIQEALELAGIGYLAGRFDKGLDTVVAWEDTLSLGEQQRLAFARLYYQLPAFVVLDECTDAVSVDQEEQLYRLLLERGITCITISKRLSQTLAKFHSMHLHCGHPSLLGFDLSQI